MPKLVSVQIAVLEHCHSRQSMDSTKSVGLANKTVGHHYDTLSLLHNFLWLTAHVQDRDIDKWRLSMNLFITGSQ